MYKSLIIICLIISVELNASNYFELQTVKDKTVFYNSLIVKDSNTNEIVKTIKLLNSHKAVGIVAKNKQSPYIFFYATLKHKKGSVQIINKNSLSIQHNVTVGEINFTSNNGFNHLYMEINPDSLHLSIYVGKKNNQKILSINGKTGKIDNELILSNKTKIIKTTLDRKFFWTRFAKESKKNLVNIYDSGSFKKINSIATKSKFLVLENYNHLLFIMKQVKTLTPFSKAKYVISVLNLDNNTFFDDFTTSQPPIIFEKNTDLVYMTGRSLKEKKYFKLLKFEKNKVTKIVDKDFDIDAYSLQQMGVVDSFILFGKTSIAKFDGSNPKNNKKLYTPFKIDGGVANSDFSKTYYISYSESKVGIIDFTKKKTIAIVPIGSNAKKLGLALFNVAGFAGLAVLANAGLVVIPGTRISKNSLMLNHDESLLFAISSRTNDVTVMNANNLSNKKTFSTGRGTSQIIQAGTENSPVVVVSKKRVSFFDSKTGNYLGKVKYDEIIKITNNLMLYFNKGSKTSFVSLLNVPEILDNS